MKKGIPAKQVAKLQDELADKRKNYLKLRYFVTLYNDVDELRAMLLHALDHHNRDYEFSEEVFNHHPILPHI
jgi:hypothetical protein